MTSFSWTISLCWYIEILVHSFHLLPLFVTYGGEMSVCLSVTHKWSHLNISCGAFYPTTWFRSFIPHPSNFSPQKSNCLYKSKSFSLSHKGPQLQSADRDSKGPGEQQEYAGPESEPQWHRLHPKPAVHQPNRPVVSGPERQQAGQPAPPDETPSSPSDPHTE